MTTPTLRQAAQALLSCVDGIEGNRPQFIGLAADSLRAALAAPEPVDPVPVVAYVRRDTVERWRGQDMNIAMMFPSPKGLANPAGVVLHNAHLAAIAAKDAEIAALKADAERYRWLRTNQQYTIHVCGDAIHCGGHHLKRPEEFGPAFDEAIDKESKT